jgi:hypothetical protein
MFDSACSDFVPTRTGAGLGLHRFAFFVDDPMVSEGKTNLLSRLKASGSLLASMLLFISQVSELV